MSRRGLRVKARTIWTIVAAAAFVCSLGGPFSGSGVSTANRLDLALLHLTVATVLILLLPRRSASS